MMEDRILRRKNVRESTGLSDSQVDREEEAGNFPKRRKITERTVGWSYIEIQAWIYSRLHADAEAKQ